MASNPATGQLVQITTSEMTLDENKYRVSAIDRQLVMLEIICSICDGSGTKGLETCISCSGAGTTGKHRVHHSRIARIFGSEGETIYNSEPIEKETKMATPKAPKASAATAPATPAVDIATLRGDGELFARSVGFDHSNIAVEANVVIAKDHKSFRVFNTYNGGLGKKSKPGKVYDLADEKTYERKVAQLSKQGYTKR